jgi:hypothetical protein
MAGQALLKRRGVPTTLCLGLAKDSMDQVEGHAWLTCGKQILTGQQDREKYTVITTFADDGKRTVSET